MLRIEGDHSRTKGNRMCTDLKAETILRGVSGTERRPVWSEDSGKMEIRE